MPRTSTENRRVFCLRASPVDEQRTHSYSSDRNAFFTFHPDSSNAISHRRAPGVTLHVPAHKCAVWSLRERGEGRGGEGRQTFQVPREGKASLPLASRVRGAGAPISTVCPSEGLPRTVPAGPEQRRGPSSCALLGMERKRKLGSGLGL